MGAKRHVLVLGLLSLGLLAGVALAADSHAGHNVSPGTTATDSGSQNGRDATGRVPTSGDYKGKVVIDITPATLDTSVHYDWHWDNETGDHAGSGCKPGGIGGSGSSFTPPTAATSMHWVVKFDVNGEYIWAKEGTTNL